MSVIGFDLGNETCVIAAVKQRGIDVLLNEESKRETPAVVSFGEKQRFLGSAGAACATMNPKSTISQVKRLIGRRFDHPDVQKDLKLLPFETSEDPDGNILIHLQYVGVRHTFKPVQILAMLLSHLKQTAEKNLETLISNCVVGIPSYFTNLQRHLYLDAATIAGLKPLRLMHDCTATALGYGIYKTDFCNGGPSCVVFVDIGHSDTQVAVVSFKPGHMKILSHAFDSNLGARDFDEVLFRHFAMQFREQYNIDVYSSTRACIRLRAACEKLKKVLSANPEAPLHIECLMDEKDVRGFIRRDEFERLSSDLLDSIVTPCQRALTDARVTAEEIQAIELVGSGSRIPAIAKILSSIFGKEPRRTLNASECVARGCALQGAMLSPVYRVKEYEVEDSLPFSIGLSLDGSPIEKLPKGVLFPKGHAIPSDKLLQFHKSDTFQMEAFYADENELPPGISPKISLSMIGPIPDSNNEHAKVKVKACLTLHGTVKLASASLVGALLDDPAMRMEDESDNGTIDAANAAENRHSEYSQPVSGFPGYDRNAKSIARLDIPINEIIYGGASESELLEAQEKEAELTEQDFKVEQAKEKKNTLESYVYEARNKMSSVYREFSSDSEKVGITEQLQQTEEWLYEDGEDESANVYAERLQDLKKLVDPIENRYKDEEARPQATRLLLDTIREYRTKAQSLRASEKEAVLTECDNCEQWIRGRNQEQDSLPKNIDPVLRSTDIEKELKALQARYTRIVNSKGSPPRSEDNADSEDHWSRRDDMQVD